MLPRRGLKDARGSALLPVVLVLFLFSAIAIGAALVVRVEISVADRFRQSAEALYAAEAGLEVAISELRLMPTWSPVADGSHQSQFSDGAFMGSRTLPGGGVVRLCCGAGSPFEDLVAETASSAVPARRALAWWPFLWAPFASLVPQEPPSRLYVLVFAADSTGEPSAGEALLLRAEAIDPAGLRRRVEGLIGLSPPPNPEIEVSSIPRSVQAEDAVLPPSLRVLAWREVR
jgi:hypothetical protein